MADQFPREIIYSILSRLPIKSLARFRCVCKVWLKYINDPYLQTIHVKEEPTPIMFKQSQAYFNRHSEISFLRVIQGTRLFVQKYTVLKFCYKGSGQENLVLAGSCNGLTLIFYKKPLMLYKKYHTDGTFLALINPHSKQVYTLPSIKIPTSRPMDSHGPPAAAGIGFDDSTNTLKTVCVYIKKPAWSHQIHVSKHVCTLVHCSGMSSWREISQVPAYPIYGESIFAHGRLHWLAYFLNPRSHIDVDVGKIVWFDVKKEEFGLIDTPKLNLKTRRENQLVDLNGEVGFACKCKGNGIKLWILKQGEWVSYCNWFGRDLVQHQWHYASDVVVSGCWNKDGDILLTVGRGVGMFSYTLKTGDLHEVLKYDACESDIRMHRSSLLVIRGFNTSGYLIKNNL